MKNIVKLLGIIALVAVIEVTLAGCGEKEKFLKVVNQNDKPITYVSIGLVGLSWENENITKGQSKTYTLDLNDTSRNVEIGYGSRGTNDFVYQSINKTFSPGETTTVTLKANGSLE